MRIVIITLFVFIRLITFSKRELTKRELTKMSYLEFVVPYAYS